MKIQWESWRSRNILKNDAFIANIGVDTTEKEPVKIWRSLTDLQNLKIQDRLEPISRIAHLDGLLLFEPISGKMCGILHGNCPNSQVHSSPPPPLSPPCDPSSSLPLPLTEVCFPKIQTADLQWGNTHRPPTYLAIHQSAFLEETDAFFLEQRYTNDARWQCSPHCRKEEQ